MAKGWTDVNVQVESVMKQLWGLILACPCWNGLRAARGGLMDRRKKITDANWAPRKSEHEWPDFARSARVTVTLSTAQSKVVEVHKTAAEDSPCSVSA